MPITNWRANITKHIIPTSDLGIVPDQSTPIVFPDDTHVSLALLIGLRSDTQEPIVVRTNADGTIGGSGGGGSLQYCSVIRNSNFTIPSGTDTVVPFTSIVSGETWWSAGAADRVVPGAAGVYLVSFGGMIVADPGLGWRDIALRVSGSPKCVVGIYGSDSIQGVHSGSYVVVLSPTDYLQVTGGNTTPSDGRVNLLFDWSVYLNVIKIA